MRSRESLEAAIREIKSEYGEWTYDIPLPFGVWTRGCLNIPHTRLKRILQIVSDLCGKPLAECRVLDLGCLDGIFSIEFASQGAQTIGVEIREANIKKAKFCKEILQLDNLEFRQDDVRNISVESYGYFDAIVCSGLLYHLPAADGARLIETMFAMTTKLVLIDTHVALKPMEHIVHDSEAYWGTTYVEHAPGASDKDKAEALWASADNDTSFWYTRPSLINLLEKTGFSSVYECFTPAHLNFRKPGLESKDRCTFVAVKGDICDLNTSPAANGLKEKWPENSLSYHRILVSKHELTKIFYKVFARLKRGTLR